MEIRIVYRDKCNNNKLTEELIEPSISNNNAVRFIDEDKKVELSFSNGYSTDTINYSDIDCLIVNDKCYIRNGSRC